MPDVLKATPTPLATHSTIPDPSPSQYKVCADCALRIPREQAVLFHALPDFDSCLIVCSDCRWARLGIHPPPRPPHASDSPHEPSTAGAPSLGPTSSFPVQIPTLEPETPPGSTTRPPHYSNTREPPPATVSHPTILPSPSLPKSGFPPLRRAESPTEPVSFTDITHLPVRHSGKYCLYPGSTFRGLQKSGRNDCEVTVTILDVDLPASSLCGYLEIRGLTEDWPELTTYFDAEIIGAQYSFLTRGWGATHEDDLHHWSQFPAFQSKEIQNDIDFSRYTLREGVGRERSCIFMRWKERFLVPDHRVKDISGASFAGFYYICVQFEPTQRLCETEPEAEHPISPTEPIPASMSGFYFHTNSEPYQQLSLHHVPDEAMGMGNGVFEWR